MNAPGGPAEDDQSEVIAFLSDPKTHGGAPVTRIDTHGAIVFLAADRAYKLKRAVRYIYMDYATRARRTQMCAREVEINRPAAPQIYRGTAEIVRDGDGGLRFAEAGTANAVESVIVMTRFDEAQLLSQICARGEADIALMRKLAETLASYHRAAPLMPGRGGANAIAAFIEENVTLLSEMAGAPFDAAAVAAFGTDLWTGFGRVAPLLDRRRDQGRIRRCHGDLHLNNILVSGGEPVLFDALEFNDTFANIDTLYDLAFLIMDLERIGARILGHALFNRYLEFMAEDEGLAALPVYLSLRAAIRAHVGVSRARTSGDPEALAEAEACFALAQKFLAPPPPRLIAIGGYSGTGKTTLARALAPQLGAAPGAVILRSDVTRKRMLGVPEDERLPESAYTPEIGAKVFETLAARAGNILAAGHSVIVDAVYGRREERAAIEAVAQIQNAPFTGLWLAGPREALMERIAARRDDASDATVTVLEQQLAKIALPAEWTILDAGGTPQAIAAAARSQLEDGKS